MQNKKRSKRARLTRHSTWQFTQPDAEGHNTKLKKEPKRSVSTAVPVVSLENESEESGRQDQDIADEESSSDSEDDAKDEDYE